MKLSSLLYIFTFIPPSRSSSKKISVKRKNEYMGKTTFVKFFLINLFCLISFYSTSQASKVFEHRDSDLTRAEVFIADINNEESLSYLTTSSTTPTTKNYELLNNHGRSSYGTLKASVRIDPNLNISELRSLNSWADQLMRKIKACANGQNIREWYSLWNFDYCPDLKTDINEFKLRVLNFSLNSKFHKIPGQGIISYYFTNDQTGVKSKLDLKSTPWVLYYHGTSWRKSTEYKFDQGMLTGRFFEKDYLLSRYFQINKRTERIHYNPLLIQTLIEISSLQLFKPAKSQRQEGYLIWDFLVDTSWYNDEPNFEKLTALLRIVDFIHYGEVEPVEESSLNQPIPFYANCPFEAYTSSKDYTRHHRMIKTTKDDLQKLWSHFPIEFKNVFTSAHNSVRILANLSFFVSPEKFGIFPKAAASYYLSSLQLQRGDRLTMMGPFAAILSRNLNKLYPKGNCQAFDEDTTFNGKNCQNNKVEAYRFYMKDLFPQLESLEMK